MTTSTFERRVQENPAIATALRDALRAAQWGGTEVDGDGDDVDSCPCCSGFVSEGHLYDCKVAAALDEAGDPVSWAEHDPHCTCPDCIEKHMEQVEDDDELSRHVDDPRV